MIALKYIVDLTILTASIELNQIGMTLATGTSDDNMVSVSTNYINTDITVDGTTGLVTYRGISIDSTVIIGSDNNLLINFDVDASTFRTLEIYGFRSLFSSTSKQTLVSNTVIINVTNANVFNSDIFGIWVRFGSECVSSANTIEVASINAVSGTLEIINIKIFDTDGYNIIIGNKLTNTATTYIDVDGSSNNEIANNVEN